MLKLIRLSFLLMVLFSTSSQAGILILGVQYNLKGYYIEVDEPEKTIADLKVKVAEYFNINVEDFDLYEDGGASRPEKMFNDDKLIDDTKSATGIIVRLRK
ncbi:MAG: hypothetical protein Q8S31_07165 [Alphaproteobacteria bacterium]|nr:hypothetical protein [Alphaproteobacteria bacterium]